MMTCRITQTNPYDEEYYGDIIDDDVTMPNNEEYYGDIIDDADDADDGVHEEIRDSNTPDKRHDSKHKRLRCFLRHAKTILPLLRE
ncbi:unnamed protein product [Merluccius merluccius]